MLSADPAKTGPSSPIEEPGLRHHRFAQAVITVDWSIPELCAASPGSTAGYEFSLAPAMQAPLTYQDPDRQAEWSNDPVLIHQDDTLVLRFPAQADFVIGADGQTVRVVPHGALARETVSHLLIDHVLPRLLARASEIVLHAGVIDIDGRGLAFIGESGAGKSTLCTAFHRRRYPVMSDDGAVLQSLPGGGDAIVPTYPSLRLWDDTIEALFQEEPDVVPVSEHSSKRRIVTLPARDPRRGNPVLPLAAVIVLARGEENTPIALDPLPAATACIELIGQCFQFDLDDGAAVAKLFVSVTELVGRVPTLRLRYPSDYAALDEVVDTLLDPGGPIAGALRRQPKESP